MEKILKKDMAKWVRMIDQDNLSNTLVAREMTVEKAPDLSPDKKDSTKKYNDFRLLLPMRW